MKFQLIGYIHYEGMVPIFYSPILDTNSDVDANPVDVINEALQNKPQLIHNFLKLIRGKILGNLPIIKEPYIKFLMDQYNLSIYAAVMKETQNCSSNCSFAIPIALEEFLPEEMTMYELTNKVNDFRQRINEKLDDFVFNSTAYQEEILPTSITMEDDSSLMVTYPKELKSDLQRELGLSKAYGPRRSNKRGEFTYYLPLFN